MVLSYNNHRMNSPSEPILAARLGELLRQRGWKLATAESCTGGLIGSLITDVPGSSDYYLGGVVAYAYEAKEGLLGVKHETLERVGAVSAETVIEMALGARQALGADMAVSVSGIAGPGGGMPGKPVGLVWFAVSTPAGEETYQRFFQGSRVEIKSAAARTGLELLVETLQRSHGDSQGKDSHQPEKNAMEPVEVTAHWDERGQVTPGEFAWQGDRYAVDSTGRSWTEADGLHILVMAAGGHVFEVMLNSADLRWYARPSTRQPRVV